MATYRAIITIELVILYKQNYWETSYVTGPAKIGHIRTKNWLVF